MRSDWGILETVGGFSQGALRCNETFLGGMPSRSVGMLGFGRWSRSKVRPHPRPFSRGEKGAGSSGATGVPPVRSTPRSAYRYARKRPEGRRLKQLLALSFRLPESFTITMPSQHFPLATRQWRPAWSAAGGLLVLATAGCNALRLNLASACSRLWGREHGTRADCTLL